MNNETQAIRDWKRLYRAALLETDPLIALKLVEEAEHAIVERALALHREPGGHADELKSLAYSANFLAELRRVEVRLPKNNAASP
ncbi:MAG: hypothetical protein ACRD2U_12900 [Terriglobales bacterium]